MKKIYLVFIINLLLLDIVCIFALIKFVSYGENKKNDNSSIRLNNRAKMKHRSTKNDFTFPPKLLIVCGIPERPVENIILLV